jgi:hypothetical protein
MQQFLKNRILIIFKILNFTIKINQLKLNNYYLQKKYY